MSWTTPPTFVDGTDLPASDLNILGDDIGYLYSVVQGVTFSGTKVTRAAATSIADSSWTNVTFTAETFDFGSWWASGTDVIAPAGAIPSGFSTIAVMLIARAKFATNGTGNRAIRVSLNGTPVFSPTVPGISGDTTVVLFPPEFLEMAAADVITMQVYQTSGGALNASDMTLTVVRYAAAS